MNLHSLSDAVRRFFDLDVRQSPVQGISPVVSLTQDVDSYLDRGVGNVYAMRAYVAGVVNEYQAISLLRPATMTATEVEILEVHLRNLTGGAALYFGRGTSTTYTPGTGTNLDQRAVGAYYSGAQLCTESSAAPLLVAYGELLPNPITWGYWKRKGLYLPAGGLYTFRTAGQNQGIQGMIVWREYPREYQR